MTRTSRRDPVAVFTFALRERDWVLADLIAATLADRPALRRRLQEATRRSAGARASPSSLSELRSWATITRNLGIGNGDDERGEHPRD